MGLFELNLNTFGMYFGWCLGCFLFFVFLEGGGGGKIGSTL